MHRQTALQLPTAVQTVLEAQTWAAVIAPWEPTVHMPANSSHAARQAGGLCMARPCCTRLRILWSAGSRSPPGGGRLVVQLRRVQLGAGVHELALGAQAGLVVHLPHTLCVSGHCWTQLQEGCNAGARPSALATPRGPACGCHSQGTHSLGSTRGRPGGWPRRRAGHGPTGCPHAPPRPRRAAPAGR